MRIRARIGILLETTRKMYLILYLTVVLISSSMFNTNTVSAAAVRSSDHSWRKAIPELDPSIEVPELVPVKKQNGEYDDQFDRILAGSNDNQYFESHFIDRDGNEYDPYSLAWRYLGMYVDCAANDQQYLNDNVGRRDRDLSDDKDGSCQRKLLWAAYHDPRYQGGAIGEYQFYDPDTRSWNAETCTSRRCAKMDCHEAQTHFKLVGVFKETDGMYDWAEQLFKHEGYCIWNDEDVYEEMERKGKMCFRLDWLVIYAFIL